MTADDREQATRAAQRAGWLEIARQEGPNVALVEIAQRRVGLPAGTHIARQVAARLDDFEAAIREAYPALTSTHKED